MTTVAILVGKKNQLKWYDIRLQRDMIKYKIKYKETKTKLMKFSYSVVTVH